MPLRLEKFITGDIYHVFTKTLNADRPFDNPDLCSHFLETTFYYRSRKSGKMKFSRYRNLPEELKSPVEKDLKLVKYFNVDILAFNLVGTHYHFLITQLQDGGIEEFMSKVGNSFTKYFNTKFDRAGSIFYTPFKATRVVTEPQFLHTCRYILIQQYSNGEVDSFEDLLDYPFSSIGDYKKYERAKLTNPMPILDFFGKDSGKFMSFLKDRLVYQRKLEDLKR